MSSAGSTAAGDDESRSLFAPWRMSYMTMLERAGEEAAAGGKKRGSCFLRDYWLNPADDAKNHVIVRTGIPTPTMSESSSESSGGGRGGLIMLNKYPYANGHLLVCLGESRGRLLEYSEAQRAEFWSMVDLAVELVERALNPQGVNVGVNQGNAAGAGVPEHVHAHVVPRWAGDVNFMSACANVRVIPSALEEMAGRMRGVWGEMQAAFPIAIRSESTGAAFDEKDLLPFHGMAEDQSETDRLKVLLASLRRDRKPFYLTSVELEPILRWKLRGQYSRTAKHRATNSEEDIRAITQSAFAIVNSDKEEEARLRLEKLQELGGIGIGVASAILSLVHPSEYVVIDPFGWWAIYREDRSDKGFTISQYLRYRAAAAKIASSLGWTVQEVDHALWSLGMKQMPRKPG
jgi:ATP adenylyltransferase